MKILMESTAKKKKTIKDFLNIYLKDAVAVSAGTNKTYANELIRECYEQANKEGLCDDSLLKAADKKEKELKKQASKFGLKTRLNYMTDADHYKSRKRVKIDTDTMAVNHGVGASISLVVCMCSLFSHAMGGPSLSDAFKTIDPLALHGAFFAAGTVAPSVGYLAAKGADRVLSPRISDALFKSKSAEEKKSAEEYAKIKHMQLALKVLKNAILHPKFEIIRSKDDCFSPSTSQYAPESSSRASSYANAATRIASQGARIAAHTACHVHIHHVR